MGEIATRLSDYVILTNDNPRCEDEKDIMNDIVSGITKDNYEIIYNRHDAIKKGIELLSDKDILLILGKGHEDYQIIGKEKIHFSDKECALEIIKSLNQKQLRLLFENKKNHCDSYLIIQFLVISTMATIKESIKRIVTLFSK